jgi:hypothetical protein
MPFAYHPDFADTVGYEFHGLPDDPDGQVSQTIDRIRAYIRADATSPLIAEHAQRAFNLGANPNRSYAHQAIVGVWQHVKSCMRFKSDEALAADLQISDPRIPDVVEVVIRPLDQAMMIDRTGQGREDCDGFEGYAGCLLTRLGIPVALVTVSADAKRPGQFSHVYLAAYADGERIPLDFSHGPRPGWECPNMGRLREWPVALGWGDFVMPLVCVVGAYLAYSLAVRQRSFA